MSIKYRVVDGDPVGDRTCKYYHRDKCTLRGKGTFMTPCIPSCDTICIPGLMQQRDDALGFIKFLKENAS